MFEITDMQKIGVGLAGFGIFFLFLGVLLLFDKGLLALGNILFIIGLGCVIGPTRTFTFFFQRHKARASICFCGGIFIVLLGWPIVGMCIELYGFVLLFSGFFPAAINFLRRVPVLGSILNLPVIGPIDLPAMHSGRGYDQKNWVRMLPKRLEAVCIVDQLDVFSIHWPSSSDSDVTMHVPKNQVLQRPCLT